MQGCSAKIVLGGTLYFRQKSKMAAIPVLLAMHATVGKVLNGTVDTYFDTLKNEKLSSCICQQQKTLKQLV